MLLQMYLLSYIRGGQDIILSNPDVNHRSQAVILNSCTSGSVLAAHAEIRPPCGLA